MIGRRRPPMEPKQLERKSFDDFELRLGDIMRGERATIGKSLLDVQRELKIKASYIAAIENADTSAFETQGFIAGYVRSYARYLGLDPDWAYATFCEEANFITAIALETAGGAAAAGRQAGRKPGQGAQDAATRDPIAQPRVSFAPQAASTFSQIEPRAVGSILVLFALVGAIGYGGWSVLQEVQRVQVSPVDRAPTAVAEVDPLESVTFAEADLSPSEVGVSSTTPDALYRLYRPEALDSPVMTPRDGPIAALDPRMEGALAQASRNAPVALSSTSVPVSAVGPSAPTLSTGQRADAIASAVGQALQADDTETPLRVTAEDVPEVMLVAVGEVWLRVRAADGSIMKEVTMQPGDTYVVPPTDTPPTLRVGSAGAVYFAVNGKTYGPAGPNGAVLSQIALSAAPLTQDYAEVDPTAGGRGQEAVQVAETALGLLASPFDTPTPDN